jgi:hypothetical protein
VHTLVAAGALLAIAVNPILRRTLRWLVQPRDAPAPGVSRTA